MSFPLYEQKYVNASLQTASNLSFISLVSHQSARAHPLIPAPWMPWEQRCEHFLSKFLLDFLRLGWTSRMRGSSKRHKTNHKVDHILADFLFLQDLCCWGSQCLISYQRASCRQWKHPVLPMLEAWQLLGWWWADLGSITCTKFDEFSENFQTASD